MFDDRTVETIKREALAELSPQSGISPMAGSFADAAIGAAAARVSDLYAALRVVPSMLFVSEQSGEFLDLVGRDYLGITRREGTLARASLALTGTPGTLIPQGTVFLTDTGLRFTTDAAVSLGAEGTATVPITAETVGSAYNVAAGAVTKLWRNISGLDSYTNTEATGGTDTESDADLYGRIDEARRRPRTSGNGWDYRAWATEVEGIGEAKIVCLPEGAGTVGVTLVSSAFAPASPEMVAAVTAHIEEKRPIGARVLVSAPEALPLTIAASVTFNPGSTTLDEVRRTFGESVETYRRSLIEGKYQQVYFHPEEDGSFTFVYNRLLALLLTTPGVENFSSLTINGGTSDMVFDSNTIPTIGEVVVT